MTFLAITRAEAVSRDPFAIKSVNKCTIANMNLRKAHGAQRGILELF